MWQKKSFLPKPSLGTPRRFVKGLNARIPARGQTPSRIPRLKSLRVPQDTIPPADGAADMKNLYSHQESERPNTTSHSPSLASFSATETASAPESVSQTTRLKLEATSRAGAPKPMRVTDSSAEVGGADLLTSHVNVLSATDILGDSCADAQDDAQDGADMPAAYTSKHIRVPEVYDSESDGGEDVETRSYASAADTSYQIDYTPPTAERANARKLDDEDTFDVFRTPKRADELGGSRSVHGEITIDEDLIARTPAKDKNDEWLAGFGIDISLLKIADMGDGEENQDPNVTPRATSNRKLRAASDVHEVFRGGFESRAFSDVLPNPSSSHRTTDYHEAIRPRARESLAGPPTRVASATRGRRASARVSVRELEALKSISPLDEESPSQEWSDVQRGSNVFLTPVRASRRQREKNGTDLVLSEVRRSLRINRPSSTLVPKDSADGRLELLEASSHSYIPNPSLND